MINILEYTNYKIFWDELGLDSSKECLYLLYHQRRYNIEELSQTSWWKKSKKIYLIDQEVKSKIINDSVMKDPRIYFWDSSIIDHPRFHTYLWWFDHTKEVNHRLNLVDLLTPIETKKCEKFFDCLLGTMREHKWFVYNKISNHHKKDLFYQGSINPHCETQTVPGDWKSGGCHENGQSFVNFYGKQFSNVACFIPYGIYNQTWYSLVCETRSNGLQFYTEKTAKPIMSRRLFVMFGPKSCLNGLKSLGYKTFDGIVDESYDNIDDDVTRWSAAWDQIEYLLTQDPSEIYQKAMPILEHNYDIFLKTDWHSNMVKEIKKISSYDF